jgi:hypothetical protein
MDEVWYDDEDEVNPGAGNGAKRNQVAIEVAKCRLRQWADADPAQPRNMARIGAQLLAICRLYPFNMPREPYDAFRAGLLLWTMVPLIRASMVQPMPNDRQAWQDTRTGPRSIRVCHLDWLGPEDTPEAQTIRDWIEHGGDGFVLRIHGIADICTERGSRQILQSTSDVLRTMQVWGASEAYRDIVVRALRERDGA